MTSHADSASDIVESNPRRSFAFSIQQYRDLHSRHLTLSKRFSVYISLLILAGLFIVIALPYLLGWADHYFKKTPELDRIESDINRVELQQDDAIRQTPQFLASLVYTDNNSHTPGR